MLDMAVNVATFGIGVLLALLLDEDESLRGFRLVTDATGLSDVQLALLVLQSAAEDEALLLLFDSLLVLELLFTLQEDAGAFTGATTLGDNEAKEALGDDEESLAFELLLDVEPNEPPKGENIRMVFSNIARFCLLISSKVEPKGNILPSEDLK